MYHTSGFANSFWLFWVLRFVIFTQINCLSLSIEWASTIASVGYNIFIRSDKYHIGSTASATWYFWLHSIASTSSLFFSSVLFQLLSSFRAQYELIDFLEGFIESLLIFFSLICLSRFQRIHKNLTDKPTNLRSWVNKLVTSMAIEHRKKSIPISDI